MCIGDVYEACGELREEGGWRNPSGVGVGEGTVGEGEGMLKVKSTVGEISAYVRI